MDDHQQNRARVREHARTETHAAATAAGPARATRTIHRLVDAELKRLPLDDRSPVACEAGCAMCCHLRVMATPAEVFGLLAYLEETLDATAFDAFRARVRDSAAAIESLPDDRVLTTNIACPVLVGGRCSGYAARPLNCRAYHSLDVDACKASFDNPADLSLGHPQYGAVARVHEGAQSGYITGLGEAGFDSGQHELATALAEALDDPDAEVRFQRGDKAFKRARRIG